MTDGEKPVGSVIAVRGAVVDVGFASGELPRLDEALVDPEALRREWVSEVPDFRTALLLQSAWLADRELELEQRACP